MVLLSQMEENENLSNEVSKEFILKFYYKLDNSNKPIKSI